MRNNMTIYLIISIITLLLISFLGLHVYFSDKKNSLNRSFAFLIFSCFVWVFFNFMFDISKSEFFCLFWSRAALAGGALIAYSFYRFTLIFPRIKKYKFNYGHIILAFTILFIILSPTKWNIESVYLKNGSYQIVVGFLYIPFLIYFSIAILAGVLNLTYAYSAYSRLEKSQVKFILIGALIAVLTGISGSLILPILKVPQFTNFGPYGLLFFSAFTYYAIFKHRLFNIRVALAKVVAYGLYFATALLVGLFIALMNNRLARPLPFTVVAPFIALTTVVLFQLLGYYRKIAQYFYPTFRNTEIAIAKLEQKLTEVLETDVLASLVTNTLSQAFHLQRLAVLARKLQGPLLAKSNLGFSKAVLDNFIKAIEPSLFPALQKIKKPFSCEELSLLLRRAKNSQVNDLQQLQQLLQASQISAVIPLWFRKRLVGLIVLGDKTNREPFTTDDFRLFTALSYQTSVALHNANLYSEVKKRKEELEHFYRLTVGREMKMIELKKKNIGLEAQLRESRNQKSI